MDKMTLFTEFKTFLDNTNRNPKHTVFVKKDLCYEFTDINVAMTVYTSSKSNVLVENVGNHTFLVYNRLSQPALCLSYTEVTKLVSELL